MLQIQQNKAYQNKLSNSSKQEEDSSSQKGNESHLK
jgi:hypothetical protein